ncbi:MAG: tetratricopeptide repeat protein [Pseudomonadota bacterium]
MKMSVDQALRKARSLSPEEAAALYREMLDRFPANKRVQTELQALTRARIVNPPVEDLDAVVAPYRQGRLIEALALADDLLGRFPTSEILHNIAGAITAALGRLDRAVSHYGVAVDLAPDYFEAWNNLGNALTGQGRLDEAVVSFDQAIQANPDYAEAHMNRGIALRRLTRFRESLASYERSIRLNPSCAEAYNNRGNTLLALNRSDDALADYARAIGLKPGFADAYLNRGNAFLAQQRFEAAIDSYDEAIGRAPANAVAHRNRGGALLALNRLDDALASYEQALRLGPGSALAASDVRNLRARMCLWTIQGDGEGPPLLGVGDDAIPPFHALAIDDPRHQLQAARLWSAKEYGPARPAAFHARSAADKIRIGYFSADFHNHATMRLLARVLELHDRDRFEIHAFSYGPDAQDPMRQRLLDSVDGFHPVGHLDNEAAAALARSLSIDLAVDLKGHTQYGRSGIFAHRAAPVQIGYLGYPGSLGGEFIDYLIADAVTVPGEARDCYSEQIAYLPNCYQPNDDRRTVSDRTFTRAELGLPEAGFVFCCFNNSYKITAAEFAIWMRLLTRVEGSVLWLLADNGAAVDNLRREAEARGVSADRLVFADRMPSADHLARHAHADLFLDTFAINAHTTASDALWCGVPVVTKLGASFVARVAGSLLHALDMPELVTGTAGDYERLALELATDPAKLASMKAKLATNRLTAPLFDAARYTRDLEALYERLLSGAIGLHPRQG